MRIHVAVKILGEEEGVVERGGREHTAAGMVLNVRSLPGFATGRQSCLLV